MLKEKKNLLKNLKVSSVDLCSQGVNQEAHICLTKSIDEGKDRFFKRFFYTIAKAAGMTGEQLMELKEKEMETTEPEAIKEAMIKSFESILTDESLSEEERREMIQKNVIDFYQDVEEQTKSNMEKELNRDIEKMSPEDKMTFENLIKKYSLMMEKEEGEKPAGIEMKKALEELKTTKTELEELKKSFVMKELETVVKNYEILGKDTKELTAKLYTLKKSDENGYKEYLSMLDELKEMQEQTGIFKEIGSNRGGSSKEQAFKQRIQEIRKADSSLSYEAAYVKACEETGKENF